MDRFLRGSRLLLLSMLLSALLGGMVTVARATEVDSVIVTAIDPEARYLLLAKLGIAKYMIPLTVEPDTQVVDSHGRPLALSDIRVGAQGTIRYTRNLSGDYIVETLILD